MRVRLSVSPNKVQVASLHGVYTVIDAWYSARPPLTKPSQCSRTHDHESVILYDTIAHSLLLWERLPCSSGGPCRLRGSLSLLQGRESSTSLYRGGGGVILGQGLRRITSRARYCKRAHRMARRLGVRGHHHPQLRRWGHPAQAPPPMPRCNAVGRNGEPPQCSRWARSHSRE